MEVDENKELFDLSDHCFCVANFNTGGTVRLKEKEYSEISFYKTSDEMRSEYIEKLESGNQHTSLENTIFQQSNFKL